jgi:hypothetical protein
MDFWTSNSNMALQLRWKISNAPREMLRLNYKKRIEQLGLASSIGDIGNSFTTLFSAGPLDKLTMVDQAHNLL